MRRFTRLGWLDEGTGHNETFCLPAASLHVASPRGYYRSPFARSFAVARKKTNRQANKYAPVFFAKALWTARSSKIRHFYYPVSFSGAVNSRGKTYARQGGRSGSAGIFGSRISYLSYKLLLIFYRGSDTRVSGGRGRRQGKDLVDEPRLVARRGWKNRAGVFSRG